MIGAKSITSAVLLLTMAAIAWERGALNYGYLTRLDPWVAAGIGVFACVSGTLLFRIWGMNLGSSTGLRFRRRDSLFDTQITMVDHLGGRIIIGGSTEAPPLDIPPALQRAFLITVFLFLGLSAFDNRSFTMLGRWPDLSDRFCDEIEEEDKVPGADAQGCELVRRAHSLGYAKSLGSCAPREEETQAHICMLQHRDEPYLHYAWRLLVDRSKPVLSTLSQSGFNEFKARFKKGLSRLGLLYGTHKDAITVGPRAVHHLWTNLPDPRSGLSLSPGHCQAQTSHIGDRWNLTVKTENASVLLQRVLGLLLFDPRYLPIVGVCGEFHIHWDAPADACSQLVGNPKALLERADALDVTRQVIDRCRRVLDLGGDCVPEKVVSFQCFIQDDGEVKHSSRHTVTFQSMKFGVSEVHYRMPEDTSRQPIVQALHLASLFAPGFYYGRLMSRESPTRLEKGIAFDKLFLRDDFLLAKLEYLRDADPFLGQVDLGSREDLLEVFPYHLHVRTFVEVFRRQYKQHRGRL